MGLAFSGEQVRDPIRDRIGNMTVTAGKRTGEDLPIFLFFNFKSKVSFAGWTAENFNNFSFHILLCNQYSPKKIARFFPTSES